MWFCWRVHDCCRYVFEINKVVAILAATGIILSPIYLLKMYHMTALGEITHDENKSLKDISLLEATPMIHCQP